MVCSTQAYQGKTSTWQRIPAPISSVVPSKQVLSGIALPSKVGLLKVVLVYPQILGSGDQYSKFQYSNEGWIVHNLGIHFGVQ